MQTGLLPSFSAHSIVKMASLRVRVLCSFPHDLILHAWLEKKATHIGLLRVNLDHRTVSERVIKMYLYQYLRLLCCLSDVNVIVI